MAPNSQSTSQKDASYTPTSDAVDRHGFGVSKNRKMAPTGGGRAWSEDEEIYLLQTRLQKLPYKRIAAHLKKTELACRLHYHQLSHGSSRRKRAASISSGSSPGESPVLPSLNLALNRESSSRDVTPPRSTSNREPSSPDHQEPIQLPRILPETDVSPRPSSILPKPVAMTLFTRTTSPVVETPRSLDPPPFPQLARTRLECTLPPPLTQVDIPRLQTIYAAHRTSFWGAITADYGAGVSPIVLEQAWKASLFGQTPASDRNDKTRISAILDGEGKDSRKESDEEERPRQEGEDVGTGA